MTKRTPERNPESGRCNGTQTVCLNCKQAIDDCECEEDAMPCFCDECHPEDRDD